MENNTNVDTNTEPEVKDGTSNIDETTPEDDSVKDTVTMSQEDYDKAIQSATDKVRGKYSKEIKELKDKIKELTPVEKTQAEIDLENRIAALEESERAVATQKKRLEMQELLSSKGLDKSLIDFVKEDTDIEALAGVIDGIVRGKVKNNAFVPGNHSSDETVSQEEFRAMNYSQKVELQKKSPELFKRLMANR